jgi:hypothetical protein
MSDNGSSFNAILYPMLPQCGEKDFRGSPRDSRLSLLAEASIDRAEDCRLFRFGLQLSRCTVLRSGGGNMKNFRVSAAMILAPAGVASAADTSADDIMVTKAAPAVMTGCRHQLPVDQVKRRS